MNPKIVVFFIVAACFLAGTGLIALSGGAKTSASTIVTTETVTYSISEDKRAEAAALYQEVFKAAVKENGNANWSADAAQRAVERIYGMKEVSRRTETPERIRK